MDYQAFHRYTAEFLAGGTTSHRLYPGKGAVLVSAPHSVTQWRNGAEKAAEPHTGSLALLLHEELGCPVIVKTGNCSDDANYDPVSSYREELVTYVKEKGIRFVIDLHQLAAHREMMVNLGTAGMKNLPEPRYRILAEESFAAAGLTPLTVDTPFGAFHPYTVSAYLAAACGISCLQIELNSSLLRGEGQRIDQVYGALRALIRRAGEIV